MKSGGYDRPPDTYPTPAGTPFDSPRPRGEPPYHLRPRCEATEALHRRLLAATEHRVRGQPSEPGPGSQAAAETSEQ